MKSTDNKKIIITEKGNNSNVAVSVRCGCLCDSLFFEKRKIEKNDLHRQCGLDPQSPRYFQGIPHQVRNDSFLSRTTIYLTLFISLASLKRGNWFKVRSNFP